MITLSPLVKLSRALNNIYIDHPPVFGYVSKSRSTPVPPVPERSDQDANVLSYSHFSPPPFRKIFDKVAASPIQVYDPKFCPRDLFCRVETGDKLSLFFFFFPLEPNPFPFQPSANAADPVFFSPPSNMALKQGVGPILMILSAVSFQDRRPTSLRLSPAFFPGPLLLHNQTSPFLFFDSPLPLTQGSLFAVSLSHFARRPPADPLFPAPLFSPSLHYVFRSTVSQSQWKIGGRGVT